MTMPSKLKVSWSVIAIHSVRPTLVLSLSFVATRANGSNYHTIPNRTVSYHTILYQRSANAVLMKDLQICKKTQGSTQSTQCHFIATEHIQMKSSYVQLKHSKNHCTTSYLFFNLFVMFHTLNYFADIIPQ